MHHIPSILSTQPVLTSLTMRPDTHLLQADFSDGTHYLALIREPHDHTATAYALRVLADYITNLPTKL